MTRVNDRAHVRHLEDEAFARNLNLVGVSAEVGDTEYELRFSVCRGPVFNVLISKKVSEIQAGEVDILRLIRQELDVGAAQIDSLTETELELREQRDEARKRYDELLQNVGIEETERMTSMRMQQVDIENHYLRGVVVVLPAELKDLAARFRRWSGDPIERRAITERLARMSEEIEDVLSGNRESQALREERDAYKRSLKRSLEGRVKEADEFSEVRKQYEEKLRTWEMIAERDHGKPPGSFREVVKEMLANGYVDREIRSPQCRLEGCTNAGRYNSGYCGIHDILHNEGKGRL